MGLSKKPVNAPVATPPHAIDRHSTVSVWRTPDPDVNHTALPRPPLIWHREGLTPAWVCLDIVRFALRQEREGAIRLGLVEMRRNEGLKEEEKVEWAKRFTEGIYYASMVRLLVRWPFWH